MQRQTVMSPKRKKKERGKNKRSTTLRNTPCTLSVFPVLCPIHATNHENSEVNTVNKGTEWMK